MNRYMHKRYEPKGVEHYTLKIGDDVEVYMQPGGCVEFRQHPEWPAEGDHDDLVHICGQYWKTVLEAVKTLAERRSEDWVE